MEWNTGNPKENGRYLVSFEDGSIDILRFAKDLYKIDKYDFDDCKGKSGWYFYDSEYGYALFKKVVAWMNLPQPYKMESD